MLQQKWVGCFMFLVILMTGLLSFGQTKPETESNRALLEEALPAQISDEDMLLIAPEPEGKDFGVLPVPEPGTFRFLLTQDPGTISRAYIVYESEPGAATRATVRCSINGLPPHEDPGTASGMRLEEVNPRWLHRGVNEVRFTSGPATRGSADRITDLRELALAQMETPAPAAPRNLRLAILTHDGGGLMDQGTTPRLAVGPPLADAGRGVRLRGFAAPPINASGPAELYVDGVRVAEAVHHVDGAFDLYVPRATGPYAFQDADESWAVELELVYPDGTRLGQTLQLDGIAAEGTWPDDGEDESRDDGEDDGEDNGRDDGEDESRRGRSTSSDAKRTDNVGATLALPDQPSGSTLEPNSLTELESADPAASITVIEAPVANPDGTATLALPLDLPAGRRGLAPELTLTYSSAAPNGWMGLGWDLSTSSIEVDTRFGVPRYDPSFETESYLLDGRFLAPAADKSEARQDDRIFTRRVEGSFERIVRRGSRPGEFWWEVTDKSGTRYLYGSQETSRLSSPRSPFETFRWHLDRIVDLHGNTVEFHYEVDRGDNGEPWVQVYLSRIDYTGGPGVPPYYQVVFHRRDDVEPTPPDFVPAPARPDRVSTGRPGFKVYTRDLLYLVDVFAGTEPVRRYRFEYEEGDFRKSLLAAVSVTGEDLAEVLARHELDYHRMPRDGNDFAGFDPPEAWGGMSSSDDATDRFDFSGGAHVFVGLAPNPACQGHVGVQAGFNVGEANTRVDFLDLNGDGLPDRLSEDGSAELNTFDSTAPDQPGGFAADTFANTTTLGASTELTFDFGAGAHAPGELAQLGVTWVWSHTNAHRGIADVDGDGFPDLVSTQSDFRVRRNLGPAEESFSDETPWSGFSLAGLDLSIPEQDQEVLDAFHLSDTLRQLTLPYDGQVEVSGEISKLRAGGDGVRVSIHHNARRVWHREVDAGDTGACIPAPSDGCGAGLTLDVSAGDRLYFQAGSIDDTADDDLLWAPRVSYLRAPPPGCPTCAPEDVSDQHELAEAFGAALYVFDGEADFRLAGPPQGAWSAPARGTVVISGAPRKDSTADVLSAEIRHFRDAALPLTTQVHFWDLGAGAESHTDPMLTVDVEPGDVLSFHVRSATQVDPRRVRWSPSVSYEGGTYCQQISPSEPEVCGPISCDAAEVTCSVAGERAFLQPEQVTQQVEPRFDVRRNLPLNQPTVSWQAPSAGSRTLRLSREGARGAGGVLLVQGLHRLFLRSDFPAGAFEITRQLDLAAGDAVYVTVFGDASGLEVTADDDAVPVNLRVADEPGAMPSPREEPLGGGYHGWFYGEWNGDVAFRESTLGQQPTEGDSDFVAAAARRQGTGGVSGPVWVAAGFDLYLSPRGVKPSRRGMNAAAQLRHAGGGGAGGPGLLRKNYGRTAGVSANVVGVGGSLTRGFSATQLDFLDMNGDLFPDQVTPSGVRFSDGRGLFGHLESLANFSGDLRRTEDANFSLSAGLGIHFTKKSSKGDAKAVMSTMPSVGAGASLAQDRHDLVDVNGDGLPDRVEMQPGSGVLKVRLNLGYRFGGEERWPLPAWSASESSACHDVQDLSVVAGLDGTGDPNSLRLTRSGVENAGLAFGPIGGGIGTTVSRTLVDLVDVNGDALPDHVYKDDGDAAGYFRVKLNLGDRWGDEQRWQVPDWGTSLADGYNPIGLFQCLDAVSLSGNVNGNGSVGVPVCIPLVPPVPVAGLQIEVSAQLAGGEGGLQVFFRDLDGDGFADHVLKKQGDGNVYVKRNRAAKANLLSAVRRPLGGSFTLDYQRQGNRVDLSDPSHRVDMPENRWVMAALTLDDGMGPDPEGRRNNPYTTTWEYYNDAFWDRATRIDYGFARIRERRPDGSTVTTRFHNQDFYRRHLPFEQVLADTEGRLFTGRTTDYRLCPVGSACGTESPVGGEVCRDAGACFVAAVGHTTLTYEGSVADARTSFAAALPPAPKSTAVLLGYDAAGNLVRETDFADEGSGDDTIATVAYHVDPASHLQVPAHVRVEDVDGTLLRERRGTYDDRGSLARLEATLVGGRDPETGAPYSGSRNPVWRWAHDALGNAVSTTDPVGFTHEMTYDAATQTRVVRVEDGFGYVSTTEWDLKYGLPVLVTDRAGASVRREYDGFGRLVAVFGPDDLASSEPTLAFAYHPHARPASAVVRHKDVRRSDPIDTAVFVDGLLRLLQTQRDVEVDLGTGRATRVGRQVSGAPEFDAKGRLEAEGQPVFTAGTLSNPLLEAPPFVARKPVRPTRLSYDVLDRVTQVRYPQGTQTRLSFGFDDLDGVRRLLTTRTDAEDKITLTYLDLTGRVRGIKQLNRIGGVSRELVTRHDYTPLGELVSVTDPGGHTTKLTYDTLGRRIEIDNPDSGHLETRFDLGGNPGARIPAHLAVRGQQIRYRYAFNRLERIEYPRTTDIAVAYGAPGAPFFRAGRVVSVSDESGTEERFYTPLGALAHTIKTASALNGASPKGPWETRFERDSLNRLLAVTYPDGEVLTYGFDAGGRVSTVEGLLRGVPYSYVAHQGYDVFGEKARTVYGNGAESRFTRDPASRFLERLETLDGGGREIQDLRYSYSRVGTILELANDVPLPKPSRLGGPTLERFVYDDLHQLIHAEGEYRHPPNKRTVYTLDQTYDEIGNLTDKRQIHDRVQPNGKKIRQKKTSFNWSYVHGGPRPHAVTHLGNRAYHYDESGNQTGWEHDRTGRRRTVTWSEESRVRSVADNGRTTRFLYDAAGRRTNKAGPHGETIYVNPFFSVRNGTIGSKHVFVDGIRVATQVAQPSPEERKRYFYHADHVGSTHYVTDDEGELYQHLEYFPSGELWVSERSETQRTPYLFSAKELDEETGLYHFGARYYEPREGRWQSPDPIFDRMLETAALAQPDFSIHPFRMPGDMFAYAGNDPVNLVDPTGLAKTTRKAARNSAFFLRSRTGQRKAASEANRSRRALRHANGSREDGRDLLRIAKRVQSVLDDFTQTKTTTAATLTAEGKIVVSSSAKLLSVAQRLEAMKLVRGSKLVFASGSGHAEVTAVNFARSKGLTPIITAASRGICRDMCQPFLRQHGVTAVNPK